MKTDHWIAQNIFQDIVEIAATMKLLRSLVVLALLCSAAVDAAKGGQSNHPDAGSAGGIIHSAAGDSATVDGPPGKGKGPAVDRSKIATLDKGDVALLIERKDLNDEEATARGIDGATVDLRDDAPGNNGDGGGQDGNANNGHGGNSGLHAPDSGDGDDPEPIQERDADHHVEGGSSHGMDPASAYEDDADAFGGDTGRKLQSARGTEGLRGASKELDEVEVDAVESVRREAFTQDFGRSAKLARQINEASRIFGKNGSPGVKGGQNPVRRLAKSVKAKRGKAKKVKSEKSSEVGDEPGKEGDSDRQAVSELESQVAELESDLRQCEYNSDLNEEQSAERESDLQQCEYDLENSSDSNEEHWLFIQMGSNCNLEKVTEKEGGRKTHSFKLTIKDMNQVTWKFSDRPHTHEETMSTQAFIDGFSTTFGDIHPNSAISFVSDHHLDEPLVAMFMNAVHGDEDADGTIFVEYSITQSTDQADISSLESYFLKGERSTSFDECTLFIDSVATENANNPTQPITEISINKPSSASSALSSYPIQYAFDGNPYSRWYGQLNDEWLQVDLRGIYEVTKLSINWGYASAKSYDVLMSFDGEAFQVVYSKTDGIRGSRTDLVNTNFSARYVRVNLKEWAGTDVAGYSINEMSVSGRFTGPSFVPPPAFYLLSPESSFVIEAQDGQCGRGTNVILWPRFDHTGEQWKLNAQKFKMNADGSIESLLCPGMLLSLQNYCDEGSNILLWDLDPTTNIQKWMINTDGMIENLHCKGMVIDIDGSASMGSNAFLKTKTGSISQRWQLVRPTAPAVFYITNPTTKSMFHIAGVPGDRCANGKQIQIQAPQITDNDKWHLEADGDLFSVSSLDCAGFALDLDGGVCDLNRNIQLWERDDWQKQNQRWRVNLDGSIESERCRGMVLGVDSGGYIVLTSNGGHSSEQWELEKASFYITNPASSKVLDIYDTGCANGNWIRLFHMDQFVGRKLWKYNTDSTIESVGCPGFVLDPGKNKGDSCGTSSLRIWQKDSQRQQKFWFKPDGSIVSFDCPTMVIDVSNESTNNDAQILMYEDGDRSNQKWLRNELTLFVIENSGPDRVLQVRPSSSSPFSMASGGCEDHLPLETMEYKEDQLNQIFRIYDDGRIESVQCPGYALTVPTSCADGDRIYIQKMSMGSPTNYQKWEVQGTLIKSMCGNDMGFDIVGRSTSFGAAIQIYTTNSNWNKQFELVPTSSDAGKSCSSYYDCYTGNCEWKSWNPFAGRICVDRLPVDGQCNEDRDCEDGLHCPLLMFPRKCAQFYQLNQGPCLPFGGSCGPDLSCDLFTWRCLNAIRQLGEACEPTSLFPPSSNCDYGMHCVPALFRPTQMTMCIRLPDLGCVERAVKEMETLTGELFQPVTDMVLQSLSTMQLGDLRGDSFLTTIMAELENVFSAEYDVFANLDWMGVQNCATMSSLIFDEHHRSLMGDKLTFGFGPEVSLNVAIFGVTAGFGVYFGPAPEDDTNCQSGWHMGLQATYCEGVMLGGSAAIDLTGFVGFFPDVSAVAGVSVETLGIDLGLFGAEGAVSIGWTTDLDKVPYDTFGDHSVTPSSWHDAAFQHFFITYGLGAGIGITIQLFDGCTTAAHSWCTG